MAMEKRVKVLLFGLGAIGGFYAFILARNPKVSLTVVARSNYEAVKSNGLIIESENHGKHTVQFDKVVRAPAEANTVFDYIACVHKAINPETVPPRFKEVADDKTTFVIIQNGVGNEEPFRKFFPRNTILSCVIWVGASQPTPGLVRHTKSEDTELGLFPNPHLSFAVENDRLEEFSILLRDGGTSVHVKSNIQIQKWEKVVWNCAWNPLTTLTDVDTHTWLHSSGEAMRMTRCLMQEMIDVGRRCNVPLDDGLTDRLINRILAMPPIFTSMHTDAKEGRPLEVDVILGYPMKKAREFGMSVPVLSTVFALTNAVNERLTRTQGGQ